MSRPGNSLAAVLAALFVTAVGARAQEQGPQQGPPFPVPNQRMPFPRVHHDTRNTGRAVEEPYWGVTDGNRTFADIPAARTFATDGWVFPREAADPNNPGSFPLRPAQEVANETPSGAPGTAPRTELRGGAFRQVTAPSTGFRGAGYHRAPATSRDDRPFAPPTESTFGWFPQIPDLNDPNSPRNLNVAVRYRIFVWLPARVAGEPRITDARYRVFYAARNPQTGALQPLRADLVVDQDVSASGWYPLQVENANGTRSDAPFFPFYAGAPGGQEMHVEMDVTTDDPDPAGRFVIADDIQFRQQFDFAGATPVVTNRHGGRVLDATGQPPAAAADYGYDAFTAEASPGADPSLVSTLFQGPETYVLGNAPLRTNNRYQNADGTPRPLFSQMQVLVARTDFVADPRDPSGTGTIQVGAVYALDWLTGAPIWRFPDPTYAPGGVRNPTFPISGGRFAPLVPGIDTIDRNGNGAIESDEVFLVGQALVGWRNPNTAPQRGETQGGGLTGAITFAPRVPVFGTLAERRLGTTGNVDVTYGANSFKALAYVGSNNGVLYALDAYGNNDATYLNPTAAPPAFGTFVPGSTNVLWTFDAAARAAVSLDDTAGAPTPPWTPFTTYHRAPTQDRADPNPPATFTWSPTVPERGLYSIVVDIPAPPTGENRITDARYFVNGVECLPVSQATGGQRQLVAANGAAFFALDAGPVQITLDNTTAGLAPSQFVVADQVTVTPLGGGVPAPGAFGTSAPTLAYQQSAPANPDSAEQRLFIGNENGVLYALDASANPYGAGTAPGGAPPALPFSKFPVWWFGGTDGLGGAIASSPAVSARPNGTPARRGVYFTTQEGRLYCVDWEGPVTKADHVNNLPLYSGASFSAAAFNDPGVRPRWTFPNRYEDIDATDNPAGADPDFFPGTSQRLAAANVLGAIAAAPVLMDFLENPADVNSAVRSYVVLAANDDNTSSSPGRVYLLDPGGDRNSFLTNPTRIGDVYAAHPLDRYSVGARLGNATPAWTHRFQYGQTPGPDPLNPLNLQLINVTTTDPTRATPARRSRPTVYVGAIGRLFAVDIDPATNLFVRWPGLGELFPGPDFGTQPPAEVPPDDTTNALSPPNPALPADQRQRPIVARLIDLAETSSVDGLAITGGPLQVRGNLPSPTYNPNLLAVNQDIRDPETQGTTTFQYPVLYVTTAGGFLYEVSSNTEGEDNATATGGSDAQSALGWALSTDPARANPEHVLVDAVQGPGGPSGPSVMTNVVFEGLDPFTSTPSALPLRPRSRRSGDVHTGQTGFPLDHNGLYNDPVASVLGREQQGALQIPNADVSPAQNTNARLGNRIVWVFSGGPDGVIYAFTPGTFGGAGGTGPGGRQAIRTRLFSTGDPKVDIFDLEDYNEYLRQARDGGDAVRPNRDGRTDQSDDPGAATRISRAAKGKGNFFEWGEIVHIIAWDLNGRGPTPTPDVGEFWAEGNSVVITITDRRTGATVLRRELAPEAETYPFRPQYMVPPRDPPAGVTPVRLGLAFLPYTLDASSRESPQTPGSLLEVRVEQRIRVREAGPGGAGTTIRDVTIPLGTGQGANDAVVLSRLRPLMAIANPLGIAGRVRDMNNAVANPAPAGGAPNPIGGAANAIGPFANDDATKGNVVPSTTTPTPAADGSTDPDRASARYSQALTNGNVIERFDYRPYQSITPGSLPTRNRAFGNSLANDPRFYVPVAASAGFVGHGSSGTTAGNLSVVNRSRLVALSQVRAARADLLWRWWPGRIPNIDATDAAGANPRITPPGMSNNGIINPMPAFEDEENLLEPQPWKSARTDVATTGTITANVNGSEDYPDIPRSAVGVSGRGGDLTQGRGTLPNPFQDSGTNVEVRVPRYQPANLVAVNNLTSTYVGPNAADLVAGGTLPVGAPGPLQLPRGITNRQLRSGGPQERWLTPYGYTSRLFLYVDSNQDGQLNLAQNTAGTTGAGTRQNSGVDYRNPDIAGPRGTYEEAYREFEVWMGVPVDLKLRAVESIVDLGSVPHGFGVQNGLMGYGQGPLPQGFLPTPLPSAYAPFFKTITVQNTGNTNLWNLRANQRFVDVLNGSLLPRSLTMRSDLVNPAFGIASFGADPNLNDPLVGANQMVQIATSLDPNFDPVYAAAGPAYAAFGGRHTLHKPKPGAVNPTVLGLPDVAGPVAAKPAVGVAVPLGTPVGTYTTPLTVFESHDTDPTLAYTNEALAYQAFPRLLSGLPSVQLTAAGPLYGGRNDLHPGDPSQAAPRAILPPNSEAFLRPRRRLNAGGDANAFEYLPHSNPSVVLKVSVQEAPLTGQIPDVALPGASSPANILTGALPSVDLLPLIDPNGDRPASALTPAAFRSATTGSLHVYLSRNATDAGENGTADPAPGRPYRLFQTSLQWDTTHRVWRAQDFGEPLTDYTNVSRLGRWFTKPAVISAPNAPRNDPDRSSNTSPFVLHDVVRDAGTGAVSAEAATLFWLNTLGAAAPGGAPTQVIYYGRIDPATGAVDGGTPLLQQPDPAVRRFGPRAVSARDPLSGENLNTVFVFYYGGVGGRWQLLYAPLRAENGAPTGSAGREQALPIPGTLSSASDPVGVFRTVLDSRGRSIPAIDLYYTGISRANQNTDIYMTRYQVLGGGNGARLAPIQLTPVQRERLQAPDRDPIWHGKHIGWFRQLNNRAILPVIYIQRAGTGAVEALQGDNDPNTPVTQAEIEATQSAWQYDQTTGLLYQTFDRTVNGRRARSIVYVDASAGTVRFRGTGTPTGSDIVFADYVPQTYRITRDTTADLGATAFLDRTLLPAVTPQNGYIRSVVRRQADMPVDRQWVIWQKGAQPGRASTLYYSTRRVGVDLKAIGALAVNESLLLSVPNGQQGGNQAVAVSVQTSGGAVPFDVDFKNGRVYVPSLYEGVPFQITYTATGNPPASNRSGTATGTFTWIDEQAAGQMIAMQRSVNEGQPAAFIDLFSGVQGANDPRLLDPTLQPGRVWLFWTSPRGRTYDIYWQTMAPFFESPSFSGLPL